MTLNTDDKQVFHTQRLTASSHTAGVILNTQWPNVTANSPYMGIQTNVAGKFMRTFQSLYRSKCGQYEGCYHHLHKLTNAPLMSVSVMQHHQSGSTINMQSFQ